MDNLQQYTSQINTPEIGLKGQKKLFKAKVLVVGIGGLGCVNALYLASSGIGTLGLMDQDNIEISNISRQPLFGLDDVGKRKVDIAYKQLKDINKNINIIKINERLTIKNIEKIFKYYDIIIDCTDNFEAKYLINDFCQLMKKPFVYGSILRFQGYAALFVPNGACYRCFHPTAPSQCDDCSSAGVLSTVPGIIGLMQATEAIKYILHMPTIAGKLLFFDAKTMNIKLININKDKKCQYCNKPNKNLLKRVNYDFDIIANNEISPIELKDLLRNNKNIQLIDVREPFEVAICKINGSINVPMNILINNLNKYKEYLNNFNKNSDNSNNNLKNLKEINNNELNNLNKLDKNKKIILYCHHGNRSKRAIELLRKLGFDAVSLEGGIERWNEEVDNEFNNC